jgi:hypothetical protein
VHVPPLGKEVLPPIRHVDVAGLLAKWLGLD